MSSADVEREEAEPQVIAKPGKEVPAEARKEPEVNKLFRMVMKYKGSD